MLLGDFWSEKNNSSGLLFFSYFSFPAWQKAYLCFTVPWDCVFLPCFGRVWRLQSQWGTLMVCSGLGLHSVPQLSLPAELHVLVGMTGEQPGGSYPLPSPGASFLLCCLKEWKGDGMERQLLSKNIIMSLDREGNSLTIAGFYRSTCLCNMFVSLGTWVRLQHKQSGI